jgi:hypothetical protein
MAALLAEREAEAALAAEAARAAIAERLADAERDAEAARLEPKSLPKNDGELVL